MNYKKDKQRWLLILYCLVMIVLLYLRDIGEYSVSKYIFAVIVIVTSIASNYQTLLSVILFTLPLMCGLPGNFFLPVWTMLIIYHQIVRKSINYSALLFSLIIILWEYAICALYPYEFSFVNFLAYGSSLIILSLLISENKISNFSSPIIAFCIGCCVLLVAIFAVYIKDPSLAFTEGGVRMGGDTYVEEGRMILRTNPNNIGFLSLSSIVCCLALLYYKKINTSLFFGLVGISFICGMYSFSRTWVLLTVLSFVLYFIFQKENKRAGYLILLAFAVFLIGYLYLNQAVLTAFIERFSGDNIETGGERTTLFTEYNNYLVQHPINFIFGVSSQLYKPVTGIYNSTHNALQQIWLSYGVLGFVIFMYLFIVEIKANYARGQLMSLLPLLSIFLFLQTIQFLNPHSGMYPLIAAFFVLKMVKLDSYKGTLFLK